MVYDSLSTPPGELVDIFVHSDNDSSRSEPLESLTGSHCSELNVCDSATFQSLSQYSTSVCASITASKTTYIFPVVFKTENGSNQLPPDSRFWKMRSILCFPFGSYPSTYRSPNGCIQVSSSGSVTNAQIGIQLLTYQRLSEASQHKAR